MRKILLILVTVVLLSSCTTKKNNTDKIQYEKPLNHELQIDRYAENEKAKNIANSILEIEDVDKVVVVVTGKTALIGMSVEDSSKLNYLKTKAVQITRSIDKNIANIKITTEPQMYNRISKLNDDILNNKPIGGIAEEFINLMKNKK
jgi:YhcN/YlaJ family sporulation lipoprotein